MGLAVIRAADGVVHALVLGRQHVDHRLGHAGRRGLKIGTGARMPAPTPLRRRSAIGPQSRDELADVVPLLLR